MGWVETILSPGFFVDNLALIALIISVMILVLADDWVMTEVIFPSADFIRNWLARLFNAFYEKRKIKSKSRLASFVRKYSSEAFATILVIGYLYIGCDLFGQYVILPILQQWQSFIMIVVLVVFLISNHIINDARKRRHFFGIGVYKNEK